MYLSTGLGVVELGSEEEASKAPQELNGQEIMGRWVTVSHLYLTYLFCLTTYLLTYPPIFYLSPPPPFSIKNKQVEQCVDPSASCTIKIRGVPFTAKAEELAEYFSAFGTVDRVTISHDRNGIAYVTFKDNASAVQVGR